MVAMAGRVRVYIACSLDGFIAGPGDDLSWLPGANEGDTAAGDSSTDQGAAEGVGFEQFMAEVGALVMGRRTYDVVTSFDVDWPYGDRPVLVLTHRPLEPIVPSVRAASGDIGEVLTLASKLAAGKDVYLDGGALIRQALDRRLVDDMIITVVPVVLGRGRPLFAGAAERHQLQFIDHCRFGDGMLQLHVRPQAQ
jgi:dihydrofolate reductase